VCLLPFMRITSSPNPGDRDSHNGWTRFRGSRHLCFPDEHQLGLDVLVTVKRNTTGSQD
jgi:hypothetical protein